MNHVIEPTAALRDQLPYPIASAWQRIIHHTDSGQRTREAFTCLEAILRMMTAIALGQIPPDRLRKMSSLDMLAKPTLGAWLTVLESASKALSEQANALTPQLARWLASPAGANPTRPGPRRAIREVIQGLVEVRNAHAHAANALADNDATWLLGELKIVTESARWLTDFALVEVRNVVTLDSGALDVQVVPWLGDRPMPRSHTAQIRGWLVENSLILADLQTGHCRSLDPWMSVGASGSHARTPHVVAAFVRSRHAVTLEDQSTSSRIERSWTEAEGRSVRVEGVSPRVLIEANGATLAQTSMPWSPPASTRRARPILWTGLAVAVIAALAWAIPWPRIGEAGPAPAEGASAVSDLQLAAAASSPGASTLPTVEAPVAAAPPRPPLTPTTAPRRELPLGVADISGTWAFRSQAYSGGVVNAFGAEYVLIVRGEGDRFIALLRRVRYVDRGVPGKSSEAFAAEVPLRSFLHDGRTWYLAKFDFLGAKNGVRPRSMAFIRDGDHVLGAWLWKPDDLVGLLYGNSGLSVDADAARIVNIPGLFPPEVQCLVAGCAPTAGDRWLMDALATLP